VPASEAEKLAAALRSAGNSSVTVRVFPETNHLFVADRNGSFVDASGRLRYSSLPSLAVRREVLGAIADWLDAHLR
jgi:acetyl esterase/lipase